MKFIKLHLANLLFILVNVAFVCMGKNLWLSVSFIVVSLFLMMMDELVKKTSPKMKKN